MQEKGVDNAFILYSYAIFLAANIDLGTRNVEIGFIEELIRRGRLAEDRWKKFHGPAAANSSIYELAFWIFRFMAIKHTSSEHWHQFGYCKMLVYNDLIGARKAFYQAIQINPKDQRIKAALTNLFKRENVSICFL